MSHTSRQPQPRHHILLRWADSPFVSRNRLHRLVHALVRLLLITFKEFEKNDLTLRSAALTYTILLSLVPILAMSTAVVKGLGGGNHLREIAYGYIDSLDRNRHGTTTDLKIQEPATETPPGAELESSSLTSHLREATDKLLAYVDKTNFATLGSIGIVGMFLGVILVFGNIELALNTIWHVGKSRSIARKVADYLALIVLMSVSINVAFAAGAFLTSPTLAARFETLIPFVWLQAFILQLVPVFCIALTFYVIYMFFPNTRVHTAPALLGACLAAILWIAVQNTYLRLQIGVSNYNAIYGSFATLPLFLVWMYLAWLFVLGGAQLAFACQNFHSYRLLPEPTDTARKLGAAFDIIDSVQKAHTRNMALTAEELIALNPEYSATLIQEVMGELVAAELLYISTTKAKILPAPASASQQPAIITAILGMHTADTPGGRASRQAIKAAVQSSAGLPGHSGGASGSGSLQDGPSST